MIFSSTGENGSKPSLIWKKKNVHHKYYKLYAYQAANIAIQISDTKLLILDLLYTLHVNENI